jgi:hypothetical protein
MSTGTTPDSQPSRRSIVTASLTALVLAMVSLVAFVLPAEYGIDPLGSGRALGLLALAPAERDALAPGSGRYVTDQVSFELAPFESVEYKYRLEQDATLVFTWQASGEVVAELHGEPDDAAPGFAERFDLARGTAAGGGYRAPFRGWHGWFWENRTLQPLTVSLEASGYFSAARVYHGGRVEEVGFDASAAGP